MKVGECEKRLGAAEREFLQTSAISFLTPLRNFLEGDWRTISVSLNHYIHFTITGYIEFLNTEIVKEHDNHILVETIQSFCLTFCFLAKLIFTWSVY